MKKILATLLTLIMATSLFAACGNNEKAEESGASTATSEENGLSGEIVIASNRTDLEENLNEYAQKFMDENPGTKVTFETIKDYESVVSTRIAGGEAPDLFFDIEAIDKGVYNEYFLPIDDIGLTADDVLFYENGRGEDGKLYVLPLTVSYTGVVYNKQAFKTAGIESVPLTIEEFWDAADKLAAADITPMGTAFKDVWPIYPWIGWTEVPVTAGNELGKDAYIEKDELFDETMLNSMNIMRDLYKKGYLEEDVYSANWDQFKLDLAQAKIGMFYSETWLPSQFVELGAKQEDIGMFPFPGATNIKAGAGKQWGVSKTTESPELAKAFLKYMIENPVDPADIPADTNIKVENPFVAELLSYGVEPLAEVNVSGRFDQLINEIELDAKAFLLQYVVEEDDATAKKLIDDWNEKWAEARKK